MNIYELLKQLNKIEPNKNYSLVSKNKILEGEKVAIRPFFKFSIARQFVFSAVFSLALLFIILGLSSLFKNFYPNFSALNLRAIRAEADAIDFQIQLSKIIYNTTQNESSLDKLINNKFTNNKEKPKGINSAYDLNTSSSTITTSTSFSAEEVLDYLSK